MKAYDSIKLTGKGMPSMGSHRVGHDSNWIYNPGVFRESDLEIQFGEISVYSI